MEKLINNFTTEELQEELDKRERVRFLQERVESLQSTLDRLVADATELGQTITLINKRAETLVVKKGGRGYSE